MWLLTTTRVWYARASHNGRNVDLHNNQLSGSIPSGLSTSTGLTSLNLNSNSLTGTVPSTISALTALTLLDLGNNPLSGSFPSQLSTLTHLQYLDTSNAGYSGSVPSTIAALQALTYDWECGVLGACSERGRGRRKGQSRGCHVYHAFCGVCECVVLVVVQVLGLVERRVDGLDSFRSGLAVKLGGAASSVEPVQR